MADGEIAETTGLLKVQGVARGSGTVPRMQCVADGEEARAARILAARRCKQAGMHWRHHNAACVCTIIAKLRSAA